MCNRFLHRGDRNIGNFKLKLQVLTAIFRSSLLCGVDSRMKRIFK
uniref:Uncharacterized protein n=1 Tax=Anguilla anguilla TaxID=7936 RepID=A0A0E9U819_ANGAN